MKHSHDIDPSFVYVATGDHGTKIGIAKSVENRMRVLQAEAVKTFYLPTKARRVELAAHRLVGVAPCHGVEWFNVDTDTAILAVENALVAEGIETRLREIPTLPEGNEIIGYLNTGRSHQGLYTQLDKLRALGVKEENLYVESDTDWELELAIKNIREGDYFLVADLAVLADKTRGQLNRVRDIVSFGAKFMLA